MMDAADVATWRKRLAESCLSVREALLNQPDAPLVRLSRKAVLELINRADALNWTLGPAPTQAQPSGTAAAESGETDNANGR